MTTAYRADSVGSLLRPDYLVRARGQFESGELAPAIYKEIEDRAVDQVIAMQEGRGHGCRHRRRVPAAHVHPSCSRPSST